MNAIAVDHLYRSQYVAALDWSRRAHATGRRLHDPVLHAEAATGLALNAGFGGAVAEAIEACSEASALVDGLTDEQIGHSADPIAARLGAAELFVDRYQDAARHAERGLSVAQALGSGHHIPVLFWTGTVRAALGRLRPAATILDEAIEVARSSDNPSMLGWALTARSLVATASGDTDVALATATEGVEAHRGSTSEHAVGLGGLRAGGSAVAGRRSSRGRAHAGDFRWWSGAFAVAAPHATGRVRAADALPPRPGQSGRSPVGGRGGRALRLRVRTGHRPSDGRSRRRRGRVAVRRRAPRR